jgi:hypothetical protein
MLVIFPHAFVLDRGNWSCSGAHLHLTHTTLHYTYPLTILPYHTPHILPYPAVPSHITIYNLVYPI